VQQSSQQSTLMRLRLRLGINDPQVLIVVGWLMALLGFLVVVPLVLVLWFSLRTVGPGQPGGAFTLNNYRETFLNPLTYELLVNTFWFSLGSIAIGLIIGIGFAWLIERTNSPLRNFGFVSVVINGAMPASMFAIAWVLVLNPRTGLLNMPFTQLLDWDKGIFNPGTMVSLIFVEGIRLSATIFLMVVGLFRSMDPALEEASSMSQVGLIKTARHVTLPILTPGLLGVVIYIATSTIGVFEIPGIMGMPADIHVLATRIFVATSQSPPDYGFATSLATIAGLLGVVGIILYHKVTKVQQKFATVTGKGFRPRRIELGRRGKAIGAGSIILFFIAGFGLPMAILIWASLIPFYQAPTPEAFKFASLDAYRFILIGPGQYQFLQGLKNSLILIMVVPLVTMLLSAVVSWFVVRGRVQGKSILDAMAFLPHSVPGIVMGLAWLILGLFVLAPAYGTIWLIALAHVSLFIAYGTRTTNGAMFQLHRELEEASAMSGVGWITTFRHVVIPLLLPSLVAGWLWIAIHSGRELTVALLLQSSDNRIISAYVWQQFFNGRLDLAASAGVLLVGIIIILVVVARYAGQKLVDR
jgi:iron(III) transport system permease protein